MYIRLRALAIVAILILIGGTISWASEKSGESKSAETKSETPTSQNLMKKIEDLEKKVKKLEKATGTDVKRKPWEPQPRPFFGLTAGYFGANLIKPLGPYDKRHGFVIETKNKRYSLFFSGFVASTFTLHENDTFSNNEFNLRFAKFSFDMFLYRIWRIRVEPFYAARGFEGQAGGGGRLLDVFIENNKFDFFTVQVGQIFVPFGVENQTDESDLLTIHHAPIAISGGRFWDRGVAVRGFFMEKYFQYKVGIFNGAGINNSNVNDDLMYAGQLRFFPFKAQSHSQTFLHVGFERTREGLNSNRADFRTSTGFEVFDGTGNNTGLAARSSAQGHTTAVSVGGRYHEAPFRIEGEFIWRRLSREFSTGRQPQNVMWGWYLTGGYLIDMGAEKGDIYGIEPVFKISFIDVDGDDRSNLVGLSMYEFTSGARFHFNKHLRVEFNWIVSYLDDRGSGVSSTIPNQGIVSNKDGSSGGLIHTFVFQLSARW